MLFLLCGAAPHRFAIAGDQVLEVVPLVPLRPLPDAPAEVAGSFSYRGRSTPTIDLTRLLEGRASVEHLSTRIVVVRYRGPASGADAVPLGLIAERATDMLRVADAELAASAGAAADPARPQELPLRSGARVPVLDVAHVVPPALGVALLRGAAGDAGEGGER